MILQHKYESKASTVTMTVNYDPADHTVTEVISVVAEDKSGNAVDISDIAVQHFGIDGNICDKIDWYRIYHEQKEVA